MSLENIFRLIISYLCEHFYKMCRYDNLEMDMHISRSTIKLVDRSTSYVCVNCPGRV